MPQEVPSPPWWFKIVMTCFRIIIRVESQTVSNSPLHSSRPTLNPNNKPNPWICTPFAKTKCICIHGHKFNYKHYNSNNEKTGFALIYFRSKILILNYLNWLFLLISVTVVVAFFVCWAPYHSQRLLFLYVSLYGQWTEPLRKINQDLFSLAGKYENKFSLFSALYFANYILLVTLTKT